MCSDEDCGPALGMPNYLCDDGVTTADPQAEMQDSGECGWTIVECPDPADPCDDLDCWPCVGECVADETCGQAKPLRPPTAAHLQCQFESLRMRLAPKWPVKQHAVHRTIVPRRSSVILPQRLQPVNFTMGGTCQTRPETCDNGSPGACGCDGLRTNTCELQGSGTDLQKCGGCLEPVSTPVFAAVTPLATPIPSGVINMNDVAGEDEPEFYSNCAPLVDNCAQGDCSCIQLTCQRASASMGTPSSFTQAVDGS